MVQKIRNEKEKQSRELNKALSNVKKAESDADKTRQRVKELTGTLCTPLHVAFVNHE